MHAMALMFSVIRLGVGRPIIAAILEMFERAVPFVTINMLKKWVETVQYTAATLMYLSTVLTICLLILMGNRGDGEPIILLLS